MRKDDLFAGFCCGMVLGVFATAMAVTIRDELRVQQPLNECERVHNVYQCRLVPTPVTPDGQPLDMSDPFHPEEN